MKSLICTSHMLTDDYKLHTSVWNLFIIPEEDWSQSKSIEEYEVNKLKNEDGYSCFYAFVQLPGHSSKTVLKPTLARI